MSSYGPGVQNQKQLLSFHQQVETHEDASMQKHQHQQFDLKVSSFSDLRTESQLNHLRLNWDQEINIKTQVEI